MKEIKKAKTQLKDKVPEKMMHTAIESPQDNADRGRSSMISVDGAVMSQTSSRDTTRSILRVPLFHSWTDLPPLACRNILIVEYRDEVAAHLTARLTEVGLRVERAVCEASALEAYVRLPADLVLVNAGLPDGSGWLLSAKLRRIAVTPHIWLYMPQPLPDAATIAEYVGANCLIAYDEDLCRLSAAIVSRVSVLPAAWTEV